MSFIRFAPSADPFAPRRGGHCGRRQAAARGPCAAPSSTPFNPLLDLFSALEKEFSTPEQASAPQPKPKTVINPKFDVLETKDAFILQGELAGVVDKKSLDIQFRDAQTIVVKGEVARRSFGGQSQPIPVEETPKAVERNEEQLPQYEEKSSSSVTTEEVVDDTASTHSYQPTVEETLDESESGSENDFEVVESPSASRIVAPKPTPVPEPAVEEVKVSEKSEGKKPEQQSQPQPQPQPEVKQQPQEPQPKFWISERSIGVFERAFTFESLIDQEGVKATLEHGILEVVIPKREAYVRRVQIQ